MSHGYKNEELDAFYFVTFQIVEWLNPLMRQI